MSKQKGAERAIGIDLGGTTIKAALVNRNSGVKRSISVETGSEHGPEHVVHQIANAIRRMADGTPLHTLRGIGIGAPGTINWGRTTLIHPPNIPGWESINLKETLQSILQEEIPVVVENDANAAALGSARFGAGKPFLLLHNGDPRNRGRRRHHP